MGRRVNTMSLNATQLIHSIPVDESAFAISVKTFTKTKTAEKDFVTSLVHKSTSLAQFILRNERYSCAS